MNVKKAAELAKKSATVLADIGKKAVGVSREVAVNRPNEVRFTAGGIATGVAAGLVIGGGIGIAAFGGAIGLPVLLVTGTVGMIAGNRSGIEKDLRTHRTKKPRN